MAKVKWSCDVMCYIHVQCKCSWFVFWIMYTWHRVHMCVCARVPLRVTVSHALRLSPVSGRNSLLNDVLTSDSRLGVRGCNTSVTRGPSDLHCWSCWSGREGSFLVFPGVLEMALSTFCLSDASPVDWTAWGIACLWCLIGV